MPTVYQNARNDEEIRKDVEAIRKVSKDISRSPEAARAFLVENGFITRNGKLASKYRSK